MAKKIDWDAVEIEYSKGTRTNLSIAEEFGISEGAIRKKAKQLGWVKDLKEKISLRADEKVRKKSYEKSTNFQDSEKQAIELEAEMQASVRLSHRKELSKQKGIFLQLTDELSDVTENRLGYEELSEKLGSDIDNEYLERKLKEILQLPGRIKSLKDLVDTYKVIVGLERQAFGISDNGNGDANQQVQRVERVIVRPGDVTN